MAGLSRGVSPQNMIFHDVNNYKQKKLDEMTPEERAAFESTIEKKKRQFPAVLIASFLIPAMGLFVSSSYNRLRMRAKALLLYLAGVCSIALWITVIFLLGASAG